MNDSVHAISEAIRQIKQIPFDNRQKDECPIKGAMEQRGQSEFINKLMEVRSFLFHLLNGPLLYESRKMASGGSQFAHYICTQITR